MTSVSSHRQTEGTSRRAAQAGSSYGAYLSTNLEQEIAAMRRAGATATRQSAPGARKVAPMVIALASLSIVPIGAIVGLVVLLNRPAASSETVDKIPVTPTHFSQEHRALVNHSAPTLSRTPAPTTTITPPAENARLQIRRESKFGTSTAD